MKRPVILLSAALLAGALAAPAIAQENPNTPSGHHHVYVKHFDSYFDAHPDVREALNRNPRLIDDPRFVANHPDLGGYLQKHPDAREAFRHHPYHFIHREHTYNVSERRWDAHHHDHDGDAD
jgi:hypothetical protein